MTYREPDAAREMRMADLDAEYRDEAYERQVIAAAFDLADDDLPDYDSPEWRQMVIVGEAYFDAITAQFNAIANAAYQAA